MTYLAKPNLLRSDFWLSARVTLSIWLADWADFSASFPHLVGDDPVFSCRCVESRHRFGDGTSLW